MNRVLVCGSNGLLGQRLASLLNAGTAYEVLNTSQERSFVFDPQPFDYTQLDISRRSDVRSLVGSFQPDVIVNAAAVTNVDWCETNREEAWKVNVTGVEILAESARRVGAHLVHVSTDYVFDGRNGPYAEEAQPNPISYYGKTKLASENAVREAEHATIIRTIVLYGSGLRLKPSFPIWVMHSLREKTKIRVVDDQYGNPIHVADLASTIIRAAEQRRTGLFHVGGGEFLNRYEFAVRVADVFGLDSSLIEPIKTADLRQPAPRPLRSGLITRKAEADLGTRYRTVTEGLMLLKHELEFFTRN